MSDQFLAEVRIFGCNFAPVGWAQCNGQIMAIAQNTALFSLLGTNYGGDGRSTFGLPNIQGVAPIGQGQAPGLSSYSVGQAGGEVNVTLLSTQIPSHTHQAIAAGSGTLESPSGAIWGEPSPQRPAVNFYATAAVTGGGVHMNPSALSIAGSSFPHNNLMPYTTMNHCIALQGIFPPRS